MNALLPATMHMELTSRAPTWMSDFIKITTRAYSYWVTAFAIAIFPLMFGIG